DAARRPRLLAARLASMVVSPALGGQAVRVPGAVLPMIRILVVVRLEARRAVGPERAMDADFLRPAIRAHGVEKAVLVPGVLDAVRAAVEERGMGLAERQHHRNPERAHGYPSRPARPRKQPA